MCYSMYFYTWLAVIHATSSQIFSLFIFGFRITQLEDAMWNVCSMADKDCFGK